MSTNFQALRTISMAMRDPDRWCIKMRYVSAKSVTTIRTVSPIRWLDERNSEFLALCLGREEPRRFVTDRCSGIELVHADDVLMPEPIEELPHLA